MSETPSISRRAILGHIPAAGLAAIVLATAIASETPADLDAALIAFAKKVEEANAVFAAILEQRVAIEARWFADKSNIELKAALYAFDEEFADPAMHASDEMLIQLAEMPARTIAGLKIKASLAEASDHLSDSIRRDILAL